MRWRPGHEQIDHPLRLGRKVRQAWQAPKRRRSGLLSRRGLSRRPYIFAEQRPQRGETKPTTAGLEKPAPGYESNVFALRIHNFNLVLPKDLQPLPLLFSDDLIKVENQPRHDGMRGQFGNVERFVPWVFALTHEFERCRSIRPI